MKKQRAEHLAVLFELAEEQFPDKDTGFLLEIAAQRARAFPEFRNVDCGDIADALIKTGRAKPAAPLGVQAPDGRGKP